MDPALVIILAMKAAAEAASGFAKILAELQQAGRKPTAQELAAATAFRKSAKGRWDDGEPTPDGSG